jgi:F-type H+-transporting ATPase subunit gamma
MASEREIRRRIRSIGTTAQITRAMQMVAASKMRKAQQAAIDIRPFVRLLYRMQRLATTKIADFTDPLLEIRPVRKRAIVLVASDKGLCGALNSNLFRLAGQFDPKSTLFIAAGRKSAQFIARTRRQLVAEFPYGDTPRYPESRAVSALARDLFLKREVDEVRIVAAQFINTMTQKPVSLEFLPICDITGVDVPGVTRRADSATDKTEYLFEPDAHDLLSYMLPVFLNVLMYAVLLNAKASEQSARMVSMSNASENAAEMIKDLTLEHNKLRQGRITQELLEIQGGAAST